MGGGSIGSLHVVIRAEEVQRDVWLVADDPAVVRDGGDVEQLAGAELVDRTVVECDGGGAGEHQPDMLDRAARGAEAGADVRAPLPSRLVRGAADGHAAEAHDFELAVLERADLVRSLEAFEINHVAHRYSPPFRSRRPSTISAPAASAR